MEYGKVAVQSTNAVIPLKQGKVERNLGLGGFYRAMHFSANARSWDRILSVCPSVRPSVTLVDCSHIGWKS